MANDTMREEFEQSPRFRGMDFQRAPKAPDYYLSPYANGAWDGWKAARALTPVAQSLLAERNRLQAEVEVLRKDAARYRWLRNGASTVANSRREFIVIEDIDALEGDFANGAEMLDAAIDAAMTNEVAK